MSRRIVFLVMFPSLLICGAARADPIVIGDIPAYSWYHGCGPTAAASILGYWDLYGYSNLFDASGSDVFLTANVQDQISSPAHNAKYDWYPDSSGLPDPSDTSIADFFHTSEGGLDYGWSFQSYAASTFIDYAAYRGYQFSSFYEYYYDGFSWDQFTGEINAGRPMMFLVDTEGSGNTDHFVPVIGYDDRGTDGLWYGLYTTFEEAETVVWEPFRGMESGNTWGIGYATFVRPESAPDGSPVPESGRALLVGFAGLFAIVCGRPNR